MISFSRARSAIRVGIGFSPARQIFQRGNDALEFRVKIFVLKRREFFERELEDVPVSPGCDRKFVIVIAQVKRAGLEADLQLTALQDASILIAQDGEKDLVLKIGFERLPLDIEIGGVKGAGAVFQDIHPPLVERLADAHVVRDKVDNLSHTVGMEIGDPGVIFRP